ncbi:hypothetical protein DL765_007687 [Monosporascus sp. GIB2]|nr:hypothetical protein DL765_007687 [Monosporascus sp. GIB2]
MNFTRASLFAALAQASSFPGTLALGAGKAKAVANGTREGLMFGLGVCSFNVDSLVGLGLDDQIQLVLQLQQLAQLEALGLVNAFAVDQLVQKEIFLSNFNLSIIKRTINDAVKRASRGNKRVVLRKLLCENANVDGPVIQDDIDEHAATEEEVVAKEVDAVEEAQAAEEMAAEDEAAAANEEAESDEKLAEEDVAQTEEDSNANAI